MPMCQLLRYINPTQLIDTLAYYYIGTLFKSFLQFLHQFIEVGYIDSSK